MTITEKQILLKLQETLKDYDRSLIKFSATIQDRGEGGAFKTLVINRIRSLPGVITVSYKKKGERQFLIFVKFLTKAGTNAENYRDTVLIPGLHAIDYLRITARSKIQSLERVG